MESRGVNDESTPLLSGSGDDKEPIEIKKPIEKKHPGAYVPLNSITTEAGKKYVNLNDLTYLDRIIGDKQVDAADMDTQEELDQARVSARKSLSRANDNQRNNLQPLKEMEQANLIVSIRELAAQIEQDEADYIKTGKFGYGSLSGMLALIVTIGGGYGLYRYISLPEIIKLSGLSYAATETNGGLCGVLYPLSNMCADVTNSSFIYPAWYCRSITGASLCPMESSVQAYTTGLIGGMNQSCLSMFDVSNFADWHQIVGDAWGCFQRAAEMCNNGSTNLQAYLLSTINVHGKTIPCGNLLPLQSLCDVESSPNYLCSTLAQNINANYSPWLYQFNNTLTSAGQTCATLYNNQISFAGGWCDWTFSLNNGLSCWERAEQLCKNPLAEKKYWMSGNRIGMLIGGIVAAIVLVSLLIVLLRRVFKAKQGINELPAHLRDKITLAAADNKLPINENVTLGYVKKGLSVIVARADIRNVTSFFAEKLTTQEAKDTYFSKLALGEGSAKQLIHDYVKNNEVPYPKQLEEVPKRRCC